MNLNFKNMILIFSLFLVLLISSAVVSAEEISTDSDDVQLVNQEILNANTDSQDIQNTVSESNSQDIQNAVSESNSQDILSANEDSNASLGTSSSLGSSKKAVSSTATKKTTESIKTSNSSNSSKTTKAVKSTKSSKSKKTFVFAPNTVGKMGKKVTLQALVFDKNGKKVKSGTVTFTLKGKSYKVKVKKGRAIKTISSPFLGLYKVKVKYNGNSAYKSSKASFKLGIDLKVNHKYYKTVEVRKGADQYFQVAVYNQYTNKPLKNFKVKVKVKSGNSWKSYIIKSNSKGIAKLSTKNLSLGIHDIRICSAYKYINTNLKGKIVVVTQDYV